MTSYYNSLLFKVHCKLLYHLKKLIVNNLLGDIFLLYSMVQSTSILCPIFLVDSFSNNKLRFNGASFRERSVS